MQTPDVRERVLTVVLGMLADYAVDDVHLIIATSLHRRMTDAEIKRAVGKKTTTPLLQIGFTITTRRIPKAL
ncbi:MAG: lactate racemase domain-containing protein [Myxococcota bacterium]